MALGPLAGEPLWPRGRPGVCAGRVAAAVSCPPGWPPRAPCTACSWRESTRLLRSLAFPLGRHEVATGSAQLTPETKSGGVTGRAGEPCAGKRRFLGPKDHFCFISHRFSPPVCAGTCVPLAGLPEAWGAVRPHPALPQDSTRLPTARPVGDAARETCLPGRAQAAGPVSAVGTVPAPSVYSRGCSLPFTSALTFSHL